jgi:hypothetical protein
VSPESLPEVLPENVMPGVACRVEHWRAQPEVGSCRSPLFRLWSGCLVRPSLTFPAAPPQMPSGGFPQYGFQLRHHAVRSGAFRRTAPRFRLIPDIPADRGAFAPACGTRLHQQGAPPLGADLWRCPSPLRPAVLAPEGFWAPLLPRLATSSARRETSASLPSLAG